MQKDALIALARKAKGMGLAVGVQTNGVYPETLDALIREHIVDRVALDIKARDLGLRIAPGAYLHLLPNIAGYVGADHVATLLATGIADRTGTALAIDIGTNTEMCLAHRGTLTSLSCASGPAFEGAHIKHGMRAANGAIERVRFVDGELEYQTIGDEPAVGLCGSGALDALAELHLAGVVDERGRLVGRLTVDEVVDVIREEGEEAALGRVGLREDEDLFATVWKSAQNRWLWLAVNLCTAFIASRVIGQFESTIEKVVALATLMTVVMGIAGNAGNQTMTLMIRSIALGQVTSGNSRRLVLKEMAIAGFNGLVWGCIAGCIAWFIYRDSPQGWLIGLTLLLAMTLNMIVGAVVGVFIPLMLERSGRDPAIGSSVLLTFTTDSMGVFIFLGLATLFFL